MLAAVVRAALLSAAAAALGLASGCAPTVPPNNSETTPPTLAWSVLNTNTKQQTTYPATATITWAQGDAYFIVLKANDPGGIKSISLSYGAVWQCANGGVAQNRNEDHAPESATFLPSSNGQVSTYEFLSVNYSPGGWDCDSPFSFAGGSASFDGQASNFANRSAEATLSIVRNS